MSINPTRRRFTLGLGTFLGVSAIPAFSASADAGTENTPSSTVTPVSFVSDLPQRTTPGQRQQLARTRKPIALGLNLSDIANPLIIGDVSQSELLRALDPASLTKCMTAMVVIDHVRLSETHTGSPLDLGDKIKLTAMDNKLNKFHARGLTVQDGLEIMMLGSRNGIANALARHIGGDVDSFVDLMNEKTKEFGMSRTYFINPSGLPADEDGVLNKSAERKDYTNVSNTEDLVRMITRALAYYPELEQITKMRNYVVNGTELRATNHLYRYQKTMASELGVTGFKTGRTNPARSCLLACARPLGEGGPLLGSLAHGQITARKSAEVSIGALKGAFQHYLLNRGEPDVSAIHSVQLMKHEQAKPSYTPCETPLPKLDENGQILPNRFVCQ